MILGIKNDFLRQEKTGVTLHGDFVLNIIFVFMIEI
jgi:hypothetical protein